MEGLGVRLSSAVLHWTLRRVSLSAYEGGAGRGLGRGLRASAAARLKQFAQLRSRAGAPVRAGATACAAVCFLPSVHAVFGLGVGTKAPTADTSKGALREAELIRQADELYQSNEVEQLYQLLLSSCSEASSAELLWRLARATCDKAKSCPPSPGSAGGGGGEGHGGARKQLMLDALECARRALSAPGGEGCSAAHKWYAIMLDYVGEYEGTKERIARAYDIKHHFLKAIELNPKDATSVHLLGYWCFVFADLPWYQHKIAAVLFATPPSSSYEEALRYFLEAEKINPNFYSMNLLMLGKAYLRLKHTEPAREYLLRARDHPVRTEDDKRAHKEATELLSSL